MRGIGRIAETLLAVAACLALAPAVAGATEATLLSPADVVAIDRARDGDVIRLSGEAIGEDLRAGATHRWVNVLGEGTAVGVWMTDADAAKVDTYGDHHSSGDLLEVVGTVNIGCDQHGGEFDVHARTVKVVLEGAPTPRPIAPWKGVVALLALSLAFIEVRLFRKYHDRSPA